MTPQEEPAQAAWASSDFVGEKVELPRDQDVPPEKRWPARYALLTAWLLPATTTRRTADVSLLRAFGIHVVGVLLTVFVILVLVAWDSPQVRRGPFTVDLVLIGYWQEFIAEFARNPGMSLAIVAGVALTIELYFVVLCGVVAPFGAARESWQDSSRHVYRRVWLHTPHACIVAIVIGVVVITPDRWRDRWQEERLALYEQAHTVPTDAKALSEYRNEQWRSVYFGRRPWFIHVVPVAEASTVAMSIIWAAWALLRGVSAWRPMRPVTEPPLCRGCGYVLTGLRRDGRCPECGRDVMKSLDPHLSPGCPWDHRAVTGRMHAYLATAGQVLLQPRQFSYRLNPVSPKRESIRYLAVSVAAVGLVVVFAIVPLAFISERSARSLLNITDILQAGIYLATVLMGIALGITGLTALVVGIVAHHRTKRNALGGVAQHAAYASVLLPVWVLISGLLFVFLMHNDVLLRALGSLIGVRPDAIAVLVWLGINLLFLVFFVGNVFRGAAGVRYATFP